MAISENKKYSSVHEGQDIDTGVTNANVVLPSQITEINTEISKKANASDTYTKTQLYTKNEIESLFESKANRDQVGGYAGLDQNLRVSDTNKFMSKDLDYFAPLQTDLGGFQAGENSLATTGAAIGSTSSTNGGGAVGEASDSRLGFSGGASTTTNDGASVGAGAYSYNGFSGGLLAKTYDGVAIGKLAQCIDNNDNPITAIQIGTGTNRTPNTMQVNTYPLLDANGKIPNERLSSHTVNQGISDAYSNTGSLTQIISWFGKLIKGITGKTNWYDAPSATLESLNTNKANVNNTAGGFVAGTGAVNTGVGAAIGNNAKITQTYGYGAAVGYGAEAGNGGAVGDIAKTGEGGAVGKGSESNYGFAGGMYARSTISGGAIGQNAQTSSGGASGNGATSSIGFAGGDGATSDYGCAVGAYAKTSRGVAAGYNAKCVNGSTNIDAIQLGTGTNATANTMQVYGYRMMNTDGSIPEDRIGSKTINQSTSTAYSNSGSLTQILSWFGKVFQALKGTTNWYDVPNITLNQAKTEIDNIKINYEQVINKNQANGYLGLDSNGKVANDKLNNHTINQSTTDAYSNTGTLTQIVSWFGKTFKTLKGTTNWYDTPNITLNQAKTEIDNIKNNYEQKANKNQANGYLGLDTNGKIPDDKFAKTIINVNNSDNKFISVTDYPNIDLNIQTLDSFNLVLPNATDITSYPAKYNINVNYIEYFSDGMSIGYYEGSNFVTLRSMAGFEGNSQTHFEFIKHSAETPWVSLNNYVMPLELYDYLKVQRGSLNNRPTANGSNLLYIATDQTPQKVFMDVGTWKEL